MAPPNMLLQAVTAFLSLSAVSASPFFKRAPAPPSKDDFYSLPKGKPDTAVTTILIPKSANNSRLISYQDFEDSSSVDCATSYALHQGKKFNTRLSKSDVLFEARLLNQGYYVNLPDYEGRKAAFRSGWQAGYATLDSIRAVLSSSKFTGIAEHDVGITIWGYSGGSIPTEWAAEMQPDYAPELKILGAAVGGIIGNINDTIHIINDTPHAGFGPAGLISLHKAYEIKEFSRLLHQETFPETRTEFMSPLHPCATEVLDKFSNKDILSYFRSGAGFLDKPLVKDITEKAGIMGKHGVPEIPMFFYHGVQDEVMPIKGNDELVGGYCNKSINSLQYIRHKVGNHAATSFAGAGRVNAFLKDRYNGVPAPKGCHMSDVMLVDLDQKNLAGFGDIIVGWLGSLTAAPFGDSWDKAVNGAEDKIKDQITGFFGAGNDEKKDGDGEEKDDDLGSKIKDITKGWW
ncbi:secretory lipase-domain-containing protein [Leptodontidium sp. MPI-SDFR-AT-0119]|nr:secretory lipase-domain-containing protein [Leptodontidium sp. MPI-SDFR-AT-0119]